MAQRYDVNTYTLAQVIHALRTIQRHYNILENSSSPFYNVLLKQNSERILDLCLINELKNSIPIKEVPYSFIELLILIWNSINPIKQISQENDSVFIFCEKYKLLNKFLENRKLKNIFFIVSKRLCNNDWNIKGNNYKCLFFKHKDNKKFTVKQNNSKQQVYEYRFDGSNEDWYVSGYIDYEILSRQPNQKCWNSIKINGTKNTEDIKYPPIYDKEGIPNIWSSCYLNSLLQVIANNDKFDEKIQTVNDLSLLLLSVKNSLPHYIIYKLANIVKNQLRIEFPWVIFI